LDLGHKAACRGKTRTPARGGHRASLRESGLSTAILGTARQMDE